MPHQTKKTNNRCKIKLSEEIKDSILNLSPDLVCVIGMDGYFKYVNPAWEKLLGYTEKVNLLYFSGHKVKHFLYYKPKEVST